MGLEAWRSEAPANIALIKYMGKTDQNENRPSNASLSYSLDHLLTVVEIWPSETGQDEWAPLTSDDFSAPKLSQKAMDRFLAHFDFLKTQMQIPGHYRVKSANNFPSDCGLASSASSFAALTKAAHLLALDMSLDRESAEALNTRDLSMLSRRGSGSSCRSLYSPWALWKEEGAEPIRLPWEHLHHQVALLEKSKKQVSSSEAHRRVSSSELFQGRTERAESRLQKLLKALNERDWRMSCDLVWADFWDMHALFETSQPAFGYMTPGTVAVLEMVREEWQKYSDGPMATLDAGANVHLLYRMEQLEVADRFSRQLSAMGGILESPGLRREDRR